MLAGTLAAARSQLGSGRIRVMGYGEPNKIWDSSIVQSLRRRMKVAHIYTSPIGDVDRDAEDEGHQHADISIAGADGHSCGVWGASKEQRSDNMLRWHRCSLFESSDHLDIMPSLCFDHQ